jgi:hypothetical protein
MWDGNIFSNMVTRNLAGWKVWLGLVFAMEWWLMLVVWVGSRSCWILRTGSWTSNPT